MAGRRALAESAQADWEGAIAGVHCRRYGRILSRSDGLGRPKQRLGIKDRAAKVLAWLNLDGEHRPTCLRDIVVGAAILEGHLPTGRTSRSSLNA